MRKLTNKNHNRSKQVEHGHCNLKVLSFCLFNTLVHIANFDAGADLSACALLVL